ncbi:MAG: TetR/AcrR family transcriptional regulator [Thermoplasmata archaeon]
MVLEEAILQATWAELEKGGYDGLTIDRVAARAHTSKPVIYRRWRNRAQLVLAALRSRMGRTADNIPDTGTLREDVLQLLRGLNGRFQRTPKDVLRGLLVDAASLDRSGHPVFEVVPDVMAVILQRARSRGEVSANRISARIARLPVDLYRHEMFVIQDVVPEPVLEEIVDQIFLPLVLG